MTTFAPEKLAKWTGGKWNAVPRKEAIRGFNFDTRRLCAGEAFVALRTGRRDGHAYLDAARVAGASAAVVEEADGAVRLPQLLVDDSLLAFQEIAGEHRRAFTGPVVGITGSCGKTTTKDLLARLLGEASTHRTEANLNNFLGVPLTLTKLDPERHERAVVEAGMNRPGEIARLTKMILPDVAVITMVGPAHLERLGTLEAIAGEKSRLGWDAGEQVPVFFPASCLAYRAFRGFGSRARVLREVTQGVGEEAFSGEEVHDYKLEVLADGGWELAFVAGPLSGQRFRFGACGRGAASNAALAAAVAAYLGVPAELIGERLAGWVPGGLRGELIEADGRRYYVDCYNANPASMADALEAFARLAGEGPRLYVLGSMDELGEAAAALHEHTGAALRLRAEDFVLLIGEHAEALRAGLLSAGGDPERVAVVADAAAAGEAVAGFEGAVFLKGSRRYALEGALPEAVRTRVERGGPC